MPYWISQPTDILEPEDYKYDGHFGIKYILLYGRVLVLIILALSDIMV